MKYNRAEKAILALQNAPKQTLTLFELNTLLRSDWAPRAINEARKIDGVIITGSNPYTLLACPDYLKPKVYTFDRERQVYVI